MPTHDAKSGDPVAAIDRLIEQYRLTKTLRLRRRALAVWRKLETRREIVEFEKPPEQVH